MPVNTTHAEYDAHISQWQRCRDAIDGSDAVKARGATYLPMLSEQTDQEYKAYQLRALWYGASARTIQGLTGAVMRKDPVVELPEGLKPFLKDVTSGGVPFESFAMTALDEVLKTGRYGVLVDMPQEMTEKQTPYWAPYIAESIVNWSTIVKDGVRVLTRVVLRECEWVNSDDDPYVLNAIEQYRVLRITDGVYEQEVFRKETTNDGQWVSQGIAKPTLRGKPMDYIPFCFMGPRTLTPEVEKPPILDLVEVNLDHYRLSADRKHGLHFCGLPVYFFAGTEKNTIIKIGSSQAITATDPQAKGQILEMSGEGLGALGNEMEADEKKMAVLGARLLEEQKKTVEASDTLETRMSGEQSVLKSVANTVSLGLSQVLQWTALWTGMSPAEAEKVTAKLNTDLMSTAMSFAELTQLVTAWQSGAMSYETFYYLMEKGELTRPGVDAETERQLIDIQKSKFDEPLDREDDDTEEEEEEDEKKAPAELVV